MLRVFNYRLSVAAVMYTLALSVCIFKKLNAIKAVKISVKMVLLNYN